MTSTADLKCSSTDGELLVPEKAEFSFPVAGRKSIEDGSHVTSLAGLLSAFTSEGAVVEDDCSEFIIREISRFEEID